MELDEVRARLESLIEFVRCEVARIALAEPGTRWKLTVSAKGSDIVWELSQFGKIA